MRVISVGRSAEGGEREGYAGTNLRNEGRVRVCILLGHGALDWHTLVVHNQNALHSSVALNSLQRFLHLRRLTATGGEKREAGCMRA